MQNNILLKKLKTKHSSVLTLVAVLSTLFFAPTIALADPVISQVQVGNITTTSAVITWHTDVASDSYVSYAPLGGTNPLLANNDNLVTSHTLTLQGLLPNTNYIYQVNSADAQGNNVSVQGSGFITLSTNPTPTPTPTGNPTPTPTPTPTTTPPPGLQYQPPASAYATGTLAKEGSTIYFLMSKDLVKIPFTSLTAFKGLGYKLNNAQTLDISQFRTASTYKLNSPTQQHPWGSWMRWKDGTVYYSHPTGPIPVPSWNVLLNNGGKSELIVPMNAEDDKVWEQHQNLPLLQLNDSRIL